MQEIRFAVSIFEGKLTHGLETRTRRTKPKLRGEEHFSVGSYALKISVILFYARTEDLKMSYAYDKLISERRHPHFKRKIHNHRLSALSRCIRLRNSTSNVDDEI